MFWFKIKSASLLASAILISIGIFSSPAESTSRMDANASMTANSQLMIVAATYTRFESNTLSLQQDTTGINKSSPLLISQAAPPTSLIWILGSGLLGLIGLKRFGLNK